MKREGSINFGHEDSANSIDSTGEVSSAAAKFSESFDQKIKGINKEVASGRIKQEINVKKMIEESDKYREQLESDSKKRRENPLDYGIQKSTEKIPVYAFRSAVERDYDEKSGKVILNVTFKDREGMHQMILDGKMIADEDGSNFHIDLETLRGQVDGIAISSEQALDYWKKYFPLEGVQREKIGERLAGEPDPIDPFDVPEN